MASSNGLGLKETINGITDSFNQLISNLTKNEKIGWVLIIGGFVLLIAGAILW